MTHPLFGSGWQQENSEAPSSSQVVREYVDKGIAQFEQYLAHHAEFDEYLERRGTSEPA